MSRVLVGVCIALVGVGVLVRLCARPEDGDAAHKADRTQAPSGGRTAPPPASISSPSPDAPVGTPEATVELESNPKAGVVAAPGTPASRNVPELLLKKREESEKRKIEERKKVDRILEQLGEEEKKRKEARKKRDEELRARGIDPTKRPLPPPLIEPPDLGPPVVLEKK